MKTQNGIALLENKEDANDWSTVNSTVNRLGEGANETNKDIIY